MPLPKIDQPLFTMTIPSTGDKVKYRPFTVKEEKILLIAQESKDIEQVIIAIKQILGNCLIDVDVDKLASFDLEYILINLRAKSVNNMLKFSIKDPDTEEDIEIEIDIADIKIVNKEEHSKIIKVTDSIALQMKYPTIDYLREMTVTESESTSIIDVATYFIDSVVEGDQVYKLEDFSKPEVTEFIDSLGSEVIAEIKNFFDTIPAMRYEYEYMNSKGEKKTFVAEGTETFFI